MKIINDVRSLGKSRPFSPKPSVIAMSGVLLGCAALGAAAQQDAASEIDEIVVTGTLIRGSAPVGANVIGLSQEEIQATGALSAIQLLQTIPQNDSFGEVLFETATLNNVTINRPSLRDIPGGLSGGSPTLVLVDGRRLVGMGVASTTLDPDIIPPALIERVEVVLDGGSATYGSDAVAGVVNFITRRDFQGVEISSRVGFADHYDAFEGSITAGHSWGSGNAYISFVRAQNDALNGKELGWFRMYPQLRPDLGLNEPIMATLCNPGNVITGNQIYALPYGPTMFGMVNTPLPGTVNDCDLTEGFDLYPRVERNTVMMGFSQELSDKVTLDVRGYYMGREVRANQGPDFYTSATVAPIDLPEFNVVSSPYYFDHLVAPGAFDVHQVDVRYGPDRIQHIDLDTFGIYPTLTVELPADWQLRLQGSYGESNTRQATRTTPSWAQNRAQSVGLFNPYDIDSSNPEAMTAITNFGTYGFAEQTLFNLKAIVDGDLFSLPGGEVKLAMGVEYQDQEYKRRDGSRYLGTARSQFEGYTISDPALGLVDYQLLPPSDALPVTKLTREVKSVFGELVIPVVGDGNALPGVRELNVSLSVRHDDYDDFGDTTNPKVGITWRPLDWFTFRGSWGESFVAPSLANNASATASSASFNSGLGFLFPPQEFVAAGLFPAVVPGQSVLTLQGNAPGIRPQTARTTSIGFDMEPPVVDNLVINLTWWEITFKGLIDIPGFVEPYSSWSTFAAMKTVHPTRAQLDEVLAAVDSIGVACAPLPECVYAINDVRITNLGNFKTDGIDLGGSWFIETGFGTVDLSVNTSYVLNREQSASPGAPFSDMLDSDYSRFRAVATVGTNIGNLRAQATLRYRSGYDLGSAVGWPPQRKVDSFTTVDLFFNYDLNGSGLLQDLSLSLSVNNLFDEDPPRYRTANSLVPQHNGYANGGTLGRLVQLGFKKRFM